MLDRKLLERYMETFFGYGTYEGQYWFVGMEEGGGNTVEELDRRLATWEQAGGRELEDLAGYHGGIQAPLYFREHPPVQATWGKLIRVLLAAQRGEDGPGQVTLETVRAYQRDRLGRADPAIGETCLLELLPLPSPSAGRWMYGSLTMLPQLATREAYREYYARRRAEHISARVKQHHPVAVVFYGYDPWYRRMWELIAGPKVSYTQIANEAGPFTVGRGRGTGTVFAVIKHPASRGLTNSYFEQVGRELSQANRQLAP